MRILVTGGSGFIGSAVCLRLVQQAGEQVINLDALTYAANQSSLDAIKDAPGYAFVHADITDRSGLDSVFDAFRPDAVIHLAAESHVDRSIEGADGFIRTNVTGTCNLLQAARRHWEKLPESDKRNFRFIHVSTDEVYGALGAGGLFTEETRYDPSSPYSASKAASDHLARAWHRTYGLPVIITNCSNNYGPRQFPEKLIPLMIISALHGRPLPVYGDGSNVRDWLYVEDHASALECILRKGAPGETYNIGGQNERSNLQVTEAICRIMDRLAPDPSGRSHSEKIAFTADRPGHDWRYAIDASKLRDHLGWAPSENFDSGLEKTVRWYLDNQSWWRPLWEKYNGERLGLLN